LFHQPIAISQSLGLVAILVFPFTHSIPPLEKEKSKNYAGSESHSPH
jgi:hypothetical protein